MIDFMVLFQVKSSQHICSEVRLIIGVLTGRDGNLERIRVNCSLQSRP